MMRRRIARALALAALLSSGAGAAAGDERLAGPERAEPLRDVARFWLEDGASRYTSAGPGSFVMVGNRAPFDPPLDLSGRAPVVRVRIHDVSRLAGAELALFGGGGAFVFPITIYTDEAVNLIRSGEWIDLSLPFSGARVVGTPDRAAIQRLEWRTSERPGPGAPLAAAWGGLFARRLPEHGVVSLTFDDGYAEHHAVAAKLMAVHGMRGTAYVMPDQVGEAGYMTLAQLRELRERYGWDVAAHHFEPFTDAPEGLGLRIGGIQRFLGAHGFGEGGAHLAYPLGKYDSRTVLPLVRARFATARLAVGGVETLPPTDRHRLRAVNVLPTTTPEEIRQIARRAQREGEWAILMFHFLVDEPEQETEYGVEALRQALAALAAEGVAVETVSEVGRRLGTAPAAPAR
jgi:peptidoglycan/xylan/chitin deacetylase (PgdA/CDA1 family)